MSSIGHLRHDDGGPFGFLQHGPGRTERVRVVNDYADNWFALFEGRRRRVHIQVGRLYIVYRGERITITIEGV